MYKVYRTDEVETVALNGVNVEINQGDFVAVMGPSGCGKSTLLNIVGLLDNPTDGDYYFFDENVSKYSESQRSAIRKKNIGFIFQSFNLIDELNVAENIELALLYHDINLDSAHGQEVMEMLRSLNTEGTTIVMVTHSAAHADYARRTVNLFDGHVVTDSKRAA
jgi:putative ABC transport system ATP-binding protein